MPQVRSKQPIVKQPEQTLYSAVLGCDDNSCCNSPPCFSLHSPQATELGLCNKVQMGWESAWWRDQQNLNLNLQVIFTQDIPEEMVRQYLYSYVYML